MVEEDDIIIVDDNDGFEDGGHQPFTGGAFDMLVNVILFMFALVLIVFLAYVVGTLLLTESYKLIVNYNPEVFVPLSGLNYTVWHADDNITSVTTNYGGVTYDIYDSWYDSGQSRTMYSMSTSCVDGRTLYLKQRTLYLEPMDGGMLITGGYPVSDDELVQSWIGTFHQPDNNGATGFVPPWLNTTLYISVEKEVAVTGQTVWSGSDNGTNWTQISGQSEQWKMAI